MISALSTYARAELASREKHYPSMVVRDEIDEQEAKDDLAAWRAIAAMTAFAAGQRDPMRWTNPRLAVAEDVEWAALEAATAKAVQRQQSRGESPRLEAVRSLHDWIVDRRRFCTTLRQAEPVSEAA